MRVLIAVAPMPAHLYPSVPLAWALQSAGHEVRVASGTELADQITATGLSAVRLGSAPDADIPQDFDETLDRFSEALAFEPGSEHDRLWKAVRFYTLAACMRYYPDAEGRTEAADALVEFARDWKPDLVIWDIAAPVGAVAARESGAASARLMWGPDYFGWLHRRLEERAPEREGQPNPLAEAMAPIFGRYGYACTQEMLLGDFTVDPLRMQLPRPESLRSVPMSWVPYNGAAPVPDWLAKPPTRPRVGLSLGVTARATLSGRDERVAAVLDAVAGMDIDVVATVNAEQLGEGEKIPDNVRTVDFLPLTQLAPTCSVFIHHGGFGTFFSAAAHQVPQMIVTAELGSGLSSGRYLEARGAGVTLPRDGLTAARVTEELSRLLNEPSFRQGAAALYADMTGAPNPGEVIPVLERMTAQYRTRK